MHKELLYCKRGRLDYVIKDRIVSSQMWKLSWRKVVEKGADRDQMHFCIKIDTAILAVT